MEITDNEYSAYSAVMPSCLMFLLGESDIQNLLELYKLSVILNSGACSNHQAYSDLFMKKYLDFYQAREELAKKFKSMSHEEVEKCRLILSHTVDSIMPENWADTSTWDNAKKVILSAPDDVITSSVTSELMRSRGTDYLITYVLPTVESAVSSFDDDYLIQLGQLDIDEELKKVQSSGAYRDSMFGRERERYGTDPLNNMIFDIKKFGYASKFTGETYSSISDIVRKLADQYGMEESKGR